MGLALDAIQPVVYPVARKLFESGLPRNEVAAQVYIQFKDKYYSFNTEINASMIDLVISFAEDDYTVSQLPEKNDECMEINIHQFSWGMDLLENLNLDDITIKLANYQRTRDRDIVFKPNGFIKSKGLKEKRKINIDQEKFKWLFRNLEKMDFNKVYAENSSGCDGWELIIELVKIDGFVKYSKKIELFSPHRRESDKMTNSLLFLYNEIMGLEEIRKYMKLVNGNRKDDIEDETT